MTPDKVGHLLGVVFEKVASVHCCWMPLLQNCIAIIINFPCNVQVDGLDKPIKCQSCRADPVEAAQQDDLLVDFLKGLA